MARAVALTDDEYLWRVQLPHGTVEGGQWARPTTPKEFAPKPGQRVLLPL